MLKHLQVWAFFAGLLAFLLSFPIMLIGGATERVSMDTIANILLVDLLLAMLLVGIGGEF